MLSFRNIIVPLFATITLILGQYPVKYVPPCHFTVNASHFYLFEQPQDIRPLHHSPYVLKTNHSQGSHGRAHITETDQGSAVCFSCFSPRHQIHHKGNVLGEVELATPKKQVWEYFQLVSPSSAALAGRYFRGFSRLIAWEQFIQQLHFLLSPHTLHIVWGI